MNVSWMVPRMRKWPWQKCYNYNRAIASVWIRCLQLIPFLEKSNIKSQINKWNGHTDIAVFLRRWDNEALKVAVRLKKKGVKIVLDTPVNYFSNQKLPQFSGSVIEQFRKFADVADCIFCSSQFIAEFGNNLGYNTVCLEDSINHVHFLNRRKKLNTEPLNLIWSGVSVKAGELNFLKKTIRENGWKLIIISDKKPDLEIPYHFVKWNYSTFPQEIVKGDVAVFPRRVDNDYDRGHSFFKIGVFLAEHVPVVCSPVPSYQRVMSKNTGCFVNTLSKADWGRAIVSISNNYSEVNFLDNPISEFSTKKMSSRYKAVFSELAG